MRNPVWLIPSPTMDIKLLFTLLVFQSSQLKNVQSVSFTVDPNAAWVKRLYNFTIESEEILSGQDDASKEIKDFPSSLPYCSDIATSLYICTNGIVAFNKDYCPYAPSAYGTELTSQWPIIAPFHADLTLAPVSSSTNSVNALVSGVYLRGVTKSDIVDRATADVRKHIGSDKFYAIWVHVSTWYNIRAWGLSQGITFQVALITDGMRSFARFSYGQMLWETFNKNFQVGYKFPTVGNKCTQTFTFPLTGHGNLKVPFDKITGNTGEQGVWLYEMTAPRSPIQNVFDITVTLKHFGSIDVNLGERISLYCSLSTYTTAEYVWYQNGKKISETKPFYIVDTKTEDGGRYTCAITLFDRTQLSKNFLDVMVKYIETPVLSIVPESVVEVNTTVLISCTVKAFPLPTYTWYKSNVISPNVIADTITMKAATKEHAGIYQCVVSNLIGQKSSNTLTVNVWELTAPTVTSTNEGLTNHGSVVVMTCTATGNAHPTMSWMDAERNTLVEGGVLRLSNVDVHSSGTYVCQAKRENTVKYSRPIHLNVTYFNQPSIAADPSNVVLENTKLTLNCSVYSLPITSAFAWYRNKVLLKNTSDSSLVMGSVSKDTSAVYSCIAYHLLGQKEAKLVVTVQYLRTPVVITKPSQNLVKECSNVLHYCSVDAFPVPSFKWYHNINVLPSVTQPYLVLNNVSLENQGSYHCEVTNVYGTVKSQVANVQVAYIREPLIEPSNKLTPNKGTNVILTCSVQAFPAVTSTNVYWEFGGKIIGLSSKLELNNIQVQSSGMYKCVAENYYGKMESDVLEITVTYLDKPDLVIYPDNTIAEEDDVTMVCTVKGHPINRIEWRKDNVVISNNASSFVVLGAKKSAGGRYKCVAYNSDGGAIGVGGDGLVESSNEIEVKIMYASTPVISLSAEPLTQGKDVVITCQADSYPVLSESQYTWKFNGQFVHNGRVLARSNLTSLDSGVYECQVNHPAGVVSKSTSLSVNYLDVPTISAIPSAEFIEGEHLILQCNCKGTLPIAYTWSHNGNQLPQSQHLGKDITFTNATLDNAGQYTCKASNIAGTRQSPVKRIEIIDNSDPGIRSSSLRPLAGSSIEITCSGRNGGILWLERDGKFVTNSLPLNINSVSRKDTGYYVCKERSVLGTKMSGVSIQVLFVSQPSLSMYPRENVIEGTTVTLEARFDSSGNHTITWYKTDVAVSRPTGKTQQQNTVVELVLGNISRTDSGTYKCVVANEAGTKPSTDVVIDVYYVDKPTMSPQSAHLIEGNDLTITCQASANPPISNRLGSWAWKFNGKTIVNNNDGHSNGGSSQVMRKLNLTKADAGVYECSTDHTAGFVSNQATVDVKYISTPTITASPSLSVLKDHQLQLTCDAEGTAPLVYNWLKNGTVAATNKQQHIIEKTVYSDAGAYTCQVSNEAGRRFSQSASVVVLDNDNPIIQASTLAPLAGTDVQLSCDGGSSEVWMEKDGRFLGNHQGNLRRILIQKVTSQDTGLYVCYEKSSTGTKMSSLVLKVLYLTVSPLKLYPSGNIVEGSDMTILCKVSSSVNYTVQWYKGSTLLQKENDETLQLYSVKKEDSGAYKCVVSSEEMPGSSEEIVSVNVYYINPVSVTANKTLVTLGDVVQLSCSTVGNPTQLLYTWMKDGKPLSPTNQQLSTNSHVIRVTSLDSSGYYACVVNNLAGSKENGIQITVNYLSKPTLTVFPSQSPMEHTPLTLICKTNGSGIIQYKWQHNQNAIPETSTDYHRQHSQLQRELVIFNVTRQDSGFYKCLVTNGGLSEEQFSDLLKIDVKYLDGLRMEASDTLVSIGETLKLTCYPTGTVDLAVFSSTMTWKKDGVVLETSATTEITTGYNNVLSRSIQSVVGDGGYYECSSGEVSNGTRITVKEPISTPSLKVIPDSNVAEGGSFTIRCDAKSPGLSPLTYEWFFDDKKLSTPAEPTASLLVIENVTRHNTGRYHCIVKNQFEKKISSVAIVFVEHIDSIVISLNKTVPTLGDRVALTCNVAANDGISGTPTVSNINRFQWRKNGDLLEKESGKTLVMTVTSVSDSGFYECMAFTNVTSRRNGTLIQVAYISSPVIVSTPREIMVERDTIALFCKVNGTGDLLYEWYFGNTVLQSENKPAMVIANASRSNSGSYKCSVRNKHSQKSSDSVELKISYLDLLPLQSSKDLSRILEGDNITVTAPSSSSSSGNQLSGRWAFNGVMKSTTEALALHGVTPLDSGVYEYVVSDGVVTRKQEVEINVNFLVTPVLTMSPNGIILQGNSIILKCSTNTSKASTGNLVYEWYKNNVKLASWSSSSSPDHVLQNVDVSGNGSYHCVAKTSLQTKQSNRVELTVNYLSKPVVPNHDIDVISGNSVVIPCDVNGTSPLTFSWRRGNTVISQSRELRIERVHVTDEGPYECFAQNIAGVKSTMVFLTVEYLTKPEIKISPSPTVNEGDTLVLSCDVTSSKKSTYQWYKDNSLLPDLSPLLIKNNIKRIDGGRYQCKVQHDVVGEKASNLVDISVHFLKQPTIKRQNTSATTLKLTCIANGRPQPSFQWTHLETVLSTKEQLIIQSYNDSYVALVQCVVKNDAALFTVSAKANDHFLNTPVLTRHPVEDLFEGQSTVLTCMVRGTAPITFAWYQNDAVVTGNSSWLILNTLTTKNDGSYRCSASNVYGTKTSDSVIISVHYLNTPVITSNIPLLNVTSGDDLKLQCATTGEPSPTYTWYHDNKLLTTTSQTLELLHVQPQTSDGVYVCRATGHTMMKEANVTLSVDYLRTPLLTVQPTTTPIERSAVLFTCSVHALPTRNVQFQWFRDGILQNHSGAEWSKKSLTRRDSGNYTCTAYTEQKSLMSTAVSLNVQYVDSPSIISQNGTFNVTENSTLIIQCIPSISSFASGPQDVLFAWYKSNVVIGETPSVPEDLLIGKSPLLTLRNVKRSQSGVYICATSNKYDDGSSEKTVFVEYLDIPVISALPNNTATEGNSVTLTCEARSSSSSNVQYSWRRNGQLMEATATPARITTTTTTALGKHLILESVARTEEGARYICIASSPRLSRASQTVVIHVNYLSDVTLSPNPTLLLVGGSYNIMCNAHGSPEPSIQWMYNGKVAVTSSNTLQLNNITLNDAKQYTCVARNNVLGKNKTIVLSVADMRKPLLEMHPSTDIRTGDSVLLSCFANVTTNLPFKYQWFKSGLLLVTNNQQQQHQQATLLLDNITLSDVGDYSCATVSDLKEDRSDTVTLDVTSWSTLSILTSPENLKPFVGEGMTLNCSAVSNKIVQYQWSHEGRITKRDGKDGGLIISKVALEDAGEYTCKALVGLKIKEIKKISVSVQFLDTPTVKILTGSQTPAESDDVILQCNTNSSSPPTILWYYNNTLLSATTTTTATATATVDSSEDLLVIKNISRKDTGVYSCKATVGLRTVHGQNAVALRVHYLSKPIINSSSEFVVKAGSTNILQCTVEMGYPSPQFKWSFKGQVLSTTSALTLVNSRPKDEGVYECVASNSFEKKSTSVGVIVKYISKPLLKISPSVNPIAGSSLALVCYTNSSENDISYRWYYGNKLLHAGRESVYIISNIERGNSGSGNYACVASTTTNIGEEESDIVSVHVQYLDKPTISKTNTTSGQIKLTCKASGNPSPTMHWVYKNKTVAISPDLLVPPTSSQDLLQLKNYACVVMNTVAEYSSVLEGSIQFLETPQIEASPSSIVDETSAIVLACSAKGTSPIMYQWYRGVSSLGDATATNVYVLNNVTRSQRGEYSCEASNGAGRKMSALLPMVVRYLDVPVIQSKTNLDSITVNQDVELECKADSFPESTIRWYRNNTEISQQSVLRLGNVQANDTSYYACAVSNGYKMLTSSTFVNIHYLEKPNLTFSPASTTTTTTNFIEGTSVILKCDVTSSDPASITWFFKDQQISPTNAGKIFSIGDDNALLLLRNLGKEQRGEYSCRAYNLFGDAFSNKLLLTVKYLRKPSISITQRNSTTLQYTCLSNGSQPIEYHWLLDGEMLLANQSTLTWTNVPEEKVLFCYAQSEAGRHMMSVKTQTKIDWSSPRIVSSSSSGEISEGDSLFMLCEIDQPISVLLRKGITTDWYKQGEELVSSNTLSLRLENTKREDSGLYFCRTSYSGITKSSPAVSVVVSYLDDPLITPRSNTFNKGDILNLTCSARSNQVVFYTWIKEGGNNGPLVDDKTSSLVFLPLQMSDEGMYTCVARSGEMEKRVNKKILVSYLSDPSIAFRPSNVVNERNYVIIQCNVEASHSVNYTWYKNNVPNLEWTQMREVVLNDVQNSDAVSYKCAVSSDGVTKMSEEGRLSVHYLHHPTIEESQLANQSKIVLSCKSKGFPIPSYTWFKDGVPIAHVTNASILIVGANETKSNYRCHVNNTVSILSVTLSGLNTAYLNEPGLQIFPSTTPKENDRIILVCSGDGSQPIKYSIHRENILIGSSGVVVISNISRTQQGGYYCKAANRNGMRQSKTILVAVEWINRPVIIIESETTDRKVGYQSYTLRCFGDGSPTVRFQWISTQNGSTLTNSPTLTIDSNSVNNRGNTGVFFKCVVSNGREEKSAEKKLEFYELTVPTLKFLTNEQHTKEGDTVIVQCAVANTSTQPITYELLSNNRELVPNDLTIIVKDNIFTLHNVTRKESGNYSCKAQNILTTRQSKDINLHVTYLDDAVITTSSSNGNADVGTIYENDTIHITCSASGLPIPKTKWTLMMNDDVVLSYNQTLIFEDIQPSQSGMLVECIAESEAGIRRRSYSLNVTYVTRPTLSYSGQLSVLLGSSLHLQCLTTTNSQSSTTLPLLLYRWYKDGNLLNSSHHQTFSGVDLKLSSVSLEDRGVYACAVALGKTLKHSKDTLYLNTAELKVTSNATLSCNVSAAVSCNDYEVSKDGKCVCIDGFYGNSCRSQSKTFQGSITVEEVCTNVTSCWKGKLFETKMNDNSFFVLVKSAFEQQLSKAIRKELTPPNELLKSSVYRYRPSVSHTVKFDLMFYFTRASVLSEQQFHDMFLSVHLVNSNAVIGDSDAVIFKLVADSAVMTGYDHCASSTSTKCDVNADCLNGETTYYCRCKDGFVGNGVWCASVDQVVNQGKSKGEQASQGAYQSTTYGLAALLGIIVVASVVIALFVMRRRRLQTESRPPSPDPTQHKDFMKPRPSCASTLSLTHNQDPAGTDARRTADDLYDSQSNSVVSNRKMTEPKGYLSSPRTVSENESKF